MIRLNFYAEGTNKIIAGHPFGDREAHDRQQRRRDVAEPPAGASVPSSRRATSTNGTGLVVCAVTRIAGVVDLLLGVAVVGRDREQAVRAQHGVGKPLAGTRRAISTPSIVGSHLPVWPTMSALA